VRIHDLKIFGFDSDRIEVRFFSKDVAYVPTRERLLDPLGMFEFFNSEAFSEHFSNKVRLCNPSS
jgi:hypothetical protein